MIERLLFNTEFILIDFFSTYGIITIICLFLSIFIKNPILQKTNNLSNYFITFIGIAYLIVFLLSTIVELNILEEESKNYLLNRMFGQYWFGFWLQPLLWFSMSQFLRIKSIQKSILLRLIFSFFFIVSIEKTIIIVTSFHRDYLPSSWTMSSSSYSSNLFFELLIKISLFSLAVVAFTIIHRKIKELKTAKNNSNKL